MTGLIPALLLGTVHFTSKSDMFTNDVDDMCTPRRQLELQTLAGHLTAFRPTKVLIERPYADREAINADYTGFLQGTRPLAADESEQIGFRLAAASRHEHVYPVDIKHRWHEPAVEAILSTDPNAREVWDRIQREGAEATAQTNQVLTNSAISAVLHHINTTDAREGYLRPYVRDFPRLVHGDNYSGADMLGNWYFRNARIHANICRTSQPDDRLAIVYGAGHIPVLEHLLENSGLFSMEDPLPYLQP